MGLFWIHSVSLGQRSSNSDAMPCYTKQARKVTFTTYCKYYGSALGIFQVRHYTLQRDSIAIATVSHFLCRWNGVRLLGVACEVEYYFVVTFRVGTILLTTE